MEDVTEDNNGKPKPTIVCFEKERFLRQESWNSLETGNGKRKIRNMSLKKSFHNGMSGAWARTVLYNLNGLDCVDNQDGSGDNHLTQPNRFTFLGTIRFSFIPYLLKKYKR